MYPHPIAAPAATDPPLKRPRGRARLSNDAGYLPAHKPSLFAQARRRRDLVEAFVSALGGEDVLSPVVLMHVRRAAELVTMTEMARADMLNGLPVDMLALVRLEGATSRAVRLLGMTIEKPLPGLQRARQRMDAQARPENTKKAAKAAARRERKPSQRQRRVRPPDDDEAQETD
jgi:hypothetical protein